jgi:uncharacterized protein with HEPN domain
MKSDAVYLHHILDAIHRIQAYLAGVAYEQMMRPDVAIKEGNHLLE